MSVELVQQVTAWLRDPVHGVNALLPVVPRPSGEPAPPAVTITDDTEAEWVAEEYVAASRLAQGPVLLVTAGVTAVTEDIRRDYSATVDVVLRYAARGLKHDVLRHGRRTLRAVQRSLHLAQPTPGQPVTRHEVQITTVAGVRELGLYEQLEDQVVILGATLTYRVTDRWALP